MNFKHYICLDIGKTCNYRCSYCSMNTMKADKYGDFYRKIKKFDSKDCYNLLKLMDKTNMNRVLIRGGEPFIYKRKIYSIINTVRKYIQIILLSNGSLVNK